MGMVSGDGPSLGKVGLRMSKGGSVGSPLAVNGRKKVCGPRRVEHRPVYCGESIPQGRKVREEVSHRVQLESRASNRWYFPSPFCAQQVAQWLDSGHVCKGVQVGGGQSFLNRTRKRSYVFVRGQAERGGDEREWFRGGGRSRRHSPSTRQRAARAKFACVSASSQRKSDLREERVRAAPLGIWRDERGGGRQTRPGDGRRRPMIDGLFIFVASSLRGTSCLFCRLP